jgi:hypothetical protein
MSGATAAKHAFMRRPGRHRTLSSPARDDWIEALGDLLSHPGQEGRRQGRAGHGRILNHDRDADTVSWSLSPVLVRLQEGRCDWTALDKLWPLLAIPDCRPCKSLKQRQGDDSGD